MLWSRSSRKRYAGAKSGLRSNMTSIAERAFTDRRGLATDAEAKARDLSSAARDQLLARIDELGDAVSTLSQDAAALARTQADTVMDELIEEFKLHPLRSLAIAMGVGITAGLYMRK